MKTQKSRIGLYFFIILFCLTVLFAAASQPETTGVTRTRNDESRTETPPDAHRESH